MQQEEMNGRADAARRECAWELDALVAQPPLVVSAEIVAALNKSAADGCRACRLVAAGVREFCQDHPASLIRDVLEKNMAEDIAKEGPEPLPDSPTADCRRNPRDVEVIAVLRKALADVMEFWMGSTENEMPAALFDGAWAALSKAREPGTDTRLPPLYSGRPSGSDRERLIRSLVELVNDQDTLNVPFRNEGACSRARALLGELNVPGFAAFKGKDPADG